MAESIVVRDRYDLNTIQSLEIGYSVTTQDGTDESLAWRVDDGEVQECCTLSTSSSDDLLWRETRVTCLCIEVEILD
jgi:hypothetical protein